MLTAWAARVKAGRVPPRRHRSRSGRLDVDGQLHDLRQRRANRLLHAVGDRVPLEDGHRRGNLEMHVGDVVETHLSHEKLLDAMNPGAMLRYLRRLLDKPRLGAPVHQLLNGRTQEPKAGKEN